MPKTQILIFPHLVPFSEPWSQVYQVIPLEKHVDGK
jgi:hypothetical protein